MEILQPGQIVQFMKKFDFRGGRLEALRLRHRAKMSSGRLNLLLRSSAGAKTRLTMDFEDVAEYRFQRRPYVARTSLVEVRLGYFDGLFFFNLDAFAEDGPPKVIDFRNSEAYIAGTRVSWETKTIGSPPPG